MELEIRYKDLTGSARLEVVDEDDVMGNNHNSEGSKLMSATAMTSEVAPSGNSCQNNIKNGDTSDGGAMKGIMKKPRSYSLDYGRKHHLDIGPSDYLSVPRRPSSRKVSIVSDDRCPRCGVATALISNLEVHAQTNCGGRGVNRWSNKPRAQKFIALAVAAMFFTIFIVTIVVILVILNKKKNESSKSVPDP